MTDGRAHLNVSLGRSCFVRCDGCYNHFGTSRELVPTNVLLDFLGHARDGGLDRVTLCGGDPLSRPDALAVLEGVRALRLAVSLDTVGTPLLGDARTAFYGRVDVPRVDAARLAELAAVVGIPLDGTSNEVVSRFRAGRPALFDEQLRVLDVLGAAGARVCVNTVAHRGNLDDVPGILPLLARFPSVVRWQIFQFTPTGPLGYRNRSRFAVEDAAFAALEAGLRGGVEGSPLRGSVDFKGNGERKGRYVLVDSAGVAWTPAGGKGAGWDPDSDETGERTVLGDIRDQRDHDAILTAVLA